MSNSALTSLCERTGVGLPRLLEARAATERRARTRRRLLSEAGLPDDIAVVFVGSWGRREVTPESDNDYYLLSEHAQQESVRLVARVEEVLKAEDPEFRRPGREGVFGDHVVSLSSLLENVGLDRDTNTNLTQRMLLVLESIDVFNATLHAGGRRDVISTYLEPPIKRLQPPRLFLNDVVRYWRTMCVDFAGKMRDRDGQGWGLRNAKLRTTRKMLFASGLLPLLRCGAMESAEIEPFLLEQFAMPPTDRVADAFLAAALPEAAADTFSAYEEFLGHMSSEDTRRILDSIKSREQADDSAIFQAVAGLGTRIETGLLQLLFDSPLGPTTRRYGIF